MMLMWIAAIQMFLCVISVTIGEAVLRISGSDRWARPWWYISFFFILGSSATLVYDYLKVAEII